ncbi:monovalent cation:proton antiporter family protein [Priestia koreensis]|uniref:monovalent cation:proton antiporter family protein n=1 Tax=Priestia koreensis TaxID=284581 RepID=UPI001F5726DC|nr:monovalent cation:proton antiporter family protein [Priestia koreensis]MCM3004905.1 monovalent cation:proton antiporter family protein [Priestia koreensis]UNL85697.1 monovalent cation:proton antiporter family protein [Priestia koreensis]
MNHDASITSLVIVVIAAFLTPILLHRFKLRILPVVVAEIIMGLIIGKSGLDLVKPDMWIETLSSLGFIFLMFLSGLEIDFSAFAGNKKKEKLSNGKEAPNAFSAALIVFMAIFIVSLVLSYLFVWAGFIENAFLMTLIISTISLGVVVPTLKEEQIMKSSIGQTILLIAVIADLVTMILLAVFVSLNDKGGGSTWLLLILFGVGVIFYVGGKVFQNRSFIETMSKGTIQIDTRAVFALIIILVGVSEKIGAENILGAFLAGVLVSLLSPNEELVHKLDSFGYGFLIPIFFVMVGVDLDVWSLFSDKKVLILMPLLLVALLISKIIPVWILKKWFDTKTVLASGFLLTSTLSLVIAAAKVGQNLNVISSQVSGALILVAIITCIITPVIFKKLFPKKQIETNRIRVNFIGANNLSLPVTRELNPMYYDVTMYHPRQEKLDRMMITDSLFEIVEIDSYEADVIKNSRACDTDILVITTGDEERNARVASAAKSEGIDRVIARVEHPELINEMREKDIEVFSQLLSTTSLFKSLIESPSVLDIITNQDMALYQVNLKNHKYDGILLRKFPFTGDVIFVRIFRGNDSIVPHGDTELKVGDELIVTGSPEYVNELKLVLQSRG